MRRQERRIAVLRVFPQPSVDDPLEVRSEPAGVSWLPTRNMTPRTEFHPLQAQEIALALGSASPICATSLPAKRPAVSAKIYWICLCLRVSGPNTKSVMPLLCAPRPTSLAPSWSKFSDDALVNYSDSIILRSAPNDTELCLAILEFALQVEHQDKQADQHRTGQTEQQRKA
jgi:hypothetical protein